MHRAILVTRFLVLSSAVSLAASTAFGANGTWTNPSGGNWSLADTGNWLGGVVADGATSTADFSTLDVNGSVGVALIETRTINKLIFGDTNLGSIGGWNLSGSDLTLGGVAPTIQVNALGAGEFVQLGNPLAGTAGLVKTGSGELRLAGAVTLSGPVVINGGTLRYDAVPAALHPITINNNSTLDLNVDWTSTTAGTGLISVGAAQTGNIIARGNRTLGGGGIGGGANSTLNVDMSDDFSTLSVKGAWNNGGSIANINFTASGSVASGGDSFVRLGFNGGGTGVAFNGATWAGSTVNLGPRVHLNMRTNSGGNTVQIGALTGSGFLDGGINVTGSGSFGLFQIGALNTNTEFSGSITSSGAVATVGGTNITKVGTGTLTLSGDLSQYVPTANTTGNRRGGITIVSAGTLAMKNLAQLPGGDSATNPSTLDIKSGAVFDVSASTISGGYASVANQQIIGAGTVNGAFIHAAGVIAPGDTIANGSTTITTNNIAGTMTFQNLTLAGGDVRLTVTPNAGSGNDAISATSLNLVSGTVSPTFLGGVGTGSYVVATAANNITGSVAGLSVNWPGRGSAPVLSVSPDQKQLVMSIDGSSFGNLTWNGATNTEWDINITANWYNPGPPAVVSPDKYFQLDNVKFLDTNGTGGAPANTAVSLSGTLTPSSVLVDASAQSYSFQGLGKISGSTGLTKSGSSTLVMTTVNDYTGPTNINGGTIDLQTSGRIGTGPLTMANGTALQHNSSSSISLPALSAPSGSISLVFLGATSTTTTLGAITGAANIAISSDTAGKITDLADGAVGAYTGIMTVNTGRIRVASSTNVFGSSKLVLASGASIANRSTGVGTADIASIDGDSSAFWLGYQGGSGATAKTWRVGAANLNNTFSGTITDGTGSSNTTAANNIVKVGTGTLTLDGTVAVVTTGDSVVHPFAGSFGVEQGTLVLGTNLHKVVLGDGGVVVTATPGGLNINGGKAVLQNYEAGAPAAVLSILDAGYDLPTKFLTGAIRSTTLAASHTLGWRDTGTNVEIAYTLPGDTDLNLAVNFDDLLSLAQNYGASSTGKVWAEGDSNYDGTVNFDDLLALAQNYGANAVQTAELLGSAGVSQQFLGDWALAQAIAPEPTSLAALGMLAMISRRRRTA